MKTQDEVIEAMKVGIKPVLDCIGFEPSKGRELLPGNPRPRLILDRCHTTWLDFKEFARSAAHGAVIHALALLRSHYPTVDLQRVVTGYAHRIDAMRNARLEDEAKESTKSLARDVDLFDKWGVVLRR